MSNELTDPHAIAKGLTKAQADMIRTGCGNHETATSEAIAELWYSISKLTPFSFRVSLSPLGLAVRQALKEMEG